MNKLLLPLLLLSFNLYAGDCTKTDFDMEYLPKTQVEKILCYEQYVLNYDLENKTALFVGEHLAKGEVFWQKRKNTFSPNKEIPEESRTTLADYSEPNFDRGHMAPSGDMTSADNEKESFLMSNMVPQTKELNRGLWKKLEENLRKLSVTHDLVIITGPIYSTPITYIGNKVPVPISTFKWIYNLTDKTEFGYNIPNRNVFSSNILDSYKIEKPDLERLTKLKLK